MNRSPKVNSNMVGGDYNHIEQKLRQIYLNRQVLVSFESYLLKLKKLKAVLLNPATKQIVF